MYPVKQRKMVKLWKAVCCSTACRPSGIIAYFRKLKDMATKLGSTRLPGSQFIHPETSEEYNITDLDCAYYLHLQVKH